MSKAADREVLFDVEIHTREAQVGSDSEQGVYAEFMSVTWHASLPGMIFRHSYKLVSSSLNADAPSGAQAECCALGKSAHQYCIFQEVSKCRDGMLVQGPGWRCMA